MNTKRGFVTLLPIIVIAILLVAVGGYLAYPNFMVQKKPIVTPTTFPSPPTGPTPLIITEPTENWDIYSSPYYNFAIGVPPGSRVRMDACYGAETCFPRFALLFGPYEENNTLIQVSMGPDEGKPLEEIADEEYRGYQVTVSQWKNPDDFVLKQTIFKNKKAYIITHIETPSTIEELITLHKERYYVFERLSGNAENFDQILSTFKFTD